MDELSKYKFRDLKLPSGGTVGGRLEKGDIDKIIEYFLRSILSNPPLEPLSEKSVEKFFLDEGIGSGYSLQTYDLASEKRKEELLEEGRNNRQELTRRFIARFGRREFSVEEIKEFVEKFRKTRKYGLLDYTDDEDIAAAIKEMVNGGNG